MKFRVMFSMVAAFFLSMLYSAQNPPTNPFKPTRRIIKGAIPQQQQPFYAAPSTKPSPFLRPKESPKHKTAPKKHKPKSAPGAKKDTSDAESQTDAGAAEAGNG